MADENIRDRLESIQILIFKTEKDVPPESESWLQIEIKLLV